MMVSQRLKAQKIIALRVKQVREGQVCKVLSKYDVNSSGANSREEVLSNLQEAMTALIPFLCKQQGLYDSFSKGNLFSGTIDKRLRII